MQIMQNVARRYGLVCLLHEKPFAGVNGSGKHNNWSMGTDTGVNLLEPGDTPHENLAVPVLLLGGHPGRQQAPGAAARVGRLAGQDHRLGANEAPPAIISIFLGAELREGLRRDRVRLRRRGDAAVLPRARRLGAAARCRCTAATATAPRRSPSPATSSSSARSAPAMSLGAPEHGAQHDRRPGDRRPRGQARGRRTAARRSRRRCSPSSRTPTPTNKRIVFDGDNYSEEWHDEAEERGLPNLAPDAGRAAVADRRADRRGVREATTCSPSASSSRATRSSSSST